MSVMPQQIVGAISRRRLKVAPWNLRFTRPGQSSLWSTASDGMHLPDVDADLNYLRSKTVATGPFDIQTR